MLWRHAIRPLRLFPMTWHASGRPYPLSRCHSACRKITRRQRKRASARGCSPGAGHWCNCSNWLTCSPRAAIVSPRTARSAAVQDHRHTGSARHPRMAPTFGGTILWNQWLAFFQRPHPPSSIAVNSRTAPLRAGVGGHAATSPKRARRACPDRAGGAGSWRRRSTRQCCGTLPVPTEVSVPISV